MSENEPAPHYDYRMLVEDGVTDYHIESRQGKNFVVMARYIEPHDSALYQEGQRVLFDHFNADFNPEESVETMISSQSSGTIRGVKPLAASPVPDFKDKKWYELTIEVDPS
jgi:hypothetical protein